MSTIPPGSILIDEADGIEHRLPRRLSGADHENHLTRNVRECRAFARDQQRRRIQEHDAAWVLGAQARHDLPHAIAAQQFRSPLGWRARRQDGKAAYIRCHHQRLDRDGFIDQGIRETRRLLQTEYPADMRLEQIRIDEQHRDVPLACQTERKIDAGEGLAVARQGTRYHDEARIRGGAGYRPPMLSG